MNNIQAKTELNQWWKREFDALNGAELTRAEYNERFNALAAEYDRRMAPLTDEATKQAIADADADLVDWANENVIGIQVR